MEVWQGLLQQGNVSFDNEQWAEAESHYQEAIAHLEPLLPFDNESIELLPLDNENIQSLLGWISGLHNLSVLYEVLEKPQVALHFLVLPHQRMLELSQNVTISDSLQTIAMQALKITLMPLLAFSKKYPTCDACMSSLTQIEELITDSQPVIH